MSGRGSTPRPARVEILNGGLRIFETRLLEQLSSRVRRRSPRSWLDEVTELAGSIALNADTAYPGKESAC
jgi:hypothetical protein